MLHCVSISNIMPCIIDLGVAISDIAVLGEEGVGHSSFIRQFNNSHVGHVLAMAQCSEHVPVGNALRMYILYCSYVMK